MSKDSTEWGGQDSTDGSESVETFDNDTVVELESTNEPEPKEITQTEALDEVTDEKPAEKEKESPKVEKEPEKKETREAPKAKGIKGILDGKMVDIDPEMQIRVKVDGKYQNVPISELRNGYSGSESLDGRATDISNREQTLQKELDDYVLERDEMTHHFGKIRDLLDDTDGDPLKAMHYLLDITGRNRNDYSKRILGHYLEEVENLQLMSEAERESYFLKQENDYLKERSESSLNETRQTDDVKNFTADLNQLRESRGVSEEDFVGAYNQLIELGENQAELTPDLVLDYATTYPAVEKAEGILESFDPELVEDDAIVQEIASVILEDPDITDDELISVLTDTFGATTAVKEVNSKMGEYYAPPEKVVREETEQPESFDDFETYGTL